MTSEHLTIFGYTVVLFIILQPNKFIKIPEKYTIYFVLFHCLVFSLLYIVMNDIFFNTCEQFTDEELPFLEKSRQEIDTVLEKYSSKEMESFNEDDIEKIMKNVTKDLTDEQIKKVKEYVFSNKANTYDSKTIDTYDPLDKDVKLNKKMNHIGDIASVEQIQYFDSLSRKQQNALERIVEDMNMEDIEKYMKLDIEKIKESIQEVGNIL